MNTPNSTAQALKSTFNDKDVRKKIKRIAIGTGGLVVVSCAYVYHRRTMDGIITLSQAAVQETMWSSYDAGIKYGLALARDVAEIAGVDAKEAAQAVSKYAFESFDKAS